MTVEDYETKRILRDLEKRHANTTDEWETFTWKLERTLANYAGRRSIQSHMIREVAELAYGHVAEVVNPRDTACDEQLQRLVGVIERLEDRVEVYRGRTVQLEEALSEKRTIREEREAAREEGETDVVISNGYVGWTVAGLEEIAYRLRSGGAIDDTPVEVSQSHARASVPAPNVVTLDHRPKEPAPPEAPTQQPLRTPFDLIWRLCDRRPALLMTMSLVLGIALSFIWLVIA